MSTENEHTELEFVVTTFGELPEPKGSGNRVLGARVWDGHRPFGIGYPFQYVIERSEHEIRIRNLGRQNEKVIQSPLRILTDSELSGERPIELEGEKPLWITIRPVPTLDNLAHQTWVPRKLPIETSTDPKGESVFRQTGLGVGIASILLMALVLLMPAKKVDQELIPPQYAKILLNPQNKAPQEKKAKGPDEKVEAGNVVAAFKSEAVRKTTSRLLDASAAKALLSKSSILDSSKAKAALKGVFDKKSNLSASSTRKALDLKDLDRSLAASKTTRSAGGYQGDAAKSAAAQGSSLVAVGNQGIGVADGLTRDEVGKVIRKHLGEVRYCYESALAREPGLEGKLVVSFTVGGTGAVKEVNVKESSGSSALDQCISNRLMGWKFPKPRQGVDVGVSYPFIFKSLDG